MCLISFQPLFSIRLSRFSLHFCQTGETFFFFVSILRVFCLFVYFQFYDCMFCLFLNFVVFVEECFSFPCCCTRCRMQVVYSIVYFSFSFIFSWFLLVQERKKPSNKHIFINVFHQLKPERIESKKKNKKCLTF